VKEWLTLHIEFLVEEPSAEAALRILVPRIAGDFVTFDVHAHQGKLDLLQSLPRRLRGYKPWLPDDWRIVVLLDRDADDCVALKAQLEAMAQSAGFHTPTAGGRTSPVQVLNRIAIEELEARFFGDISAIVAAYPGVPANLTARAGYRNPDTIRGGTWEALERELQRAGYHLGGLEKIRAAREIATHMDPSRNQSPSFRVFQAGLLELIALRRSE